MGKSILMQLQFDERLQRQLKLGER